MSFVAGILIALLGSDDFASREGSSLALAASPWAAPWVECARRIDDPEVRWRADRILEGYRSEHAARVLGSLSFPVYIDSLPPNYPDQARLIEAYRQRSDGTVDLPWTRDHHAGMLFLHDLLASGMP